MPEKDRIPKRVTACVTCELWRGDARWASEDRKYVLFEQFQRGLCVGPLETGRSTTPRHKCRAWRLWVRLNARSRQQKKDRQEVTAEDILEAENELFRVDIVDDGMPPSDD